jgi:hypothetical protein
MVVGNRVTLLWREGAQCCPEDVVGWLPGIGCEAGLGDFRNWNRPAAPGAERINGLVVCDGDQPSLDVRAVVKLGISPQGGEKRF